ncbi:MAG: hypothetical protein ACLFST_01445 [Spirochaetia bacterium]
MTDIKTNRELFIDSTLIESLDGAELRMHHPQPGEIVLKQDKPWEAGPGAMSYITVLRDERGFHMYYKGAMMRDIPEEADKTFGIADILICYAESEDGIHWNKPELDLFEFAGSKANNIVWKGIGSHGFTPFVDTRPGCPAAERYKALGFSKTDPEPKPQGTKYLFMFSSPDGLRWHQMEGPKKYGGILDRRDGNFDSQNVAFWDSEAGCYRIYFRKTRDSDQDKKGWVRDIVTAVSEDGLNWSDFSFLEYPDSPEEELYTNQVMPYPRAPHILLGFPSRYVEGRGPLTEWHEKMSAETPGRLYTSYTDGLLMSSRDGRKFHRWNEAFFRPGMPEQCLWSYGDCYQNYGLVSTAAEFPEAPEEWSIYVCQCYRSTSARIRRFTLRLDGFVSVNAPLSGGTLTTKPFVFGGDELELNYATSAAGSIRAELQDADGNALEGFSSDDCLPLFGNTISRTARYRSGASPGSLSGKPVRIKFELKDADLFSFTFRSAPG